MNTLRVIRPGHVLDAVAHAVYLERQEQARGGNPYVSHDGWVWLVQVERAYAALGYGRIERATLRRRVATLVAWGTILARRVGGRVQVTLNPRK